MNKLNILLWVSVITALIACTHKEETPEPKLRLSFSKTNCYDGDTLNIHVFLNDQPYDGEVIWTGPGVYHWKYDNLTIIPVIYSDSSTTLISAQYRSQKVTQLIRVTKRALAKPLISYQQTIQPLLNSNCNFNGCHANGSRAGKVELSCYDSTIKSVAPYNSYASLLYSALIKDDPIRVMPPAGRLHDNKIEEVKMWIEQGAKNN